jgi:deoxyribonuclease-4
MKLGAHISTAGGVELSPERATAIGCEAMQIFSRNQRQWKAKAISDKSSFAFRANYRQQKLKGVCIHASYLINLAAPEATTWKKSIVTLVDELNRAEQLGIPYVVLHPGAHKGKGIVAGWQRVSEALSRVFEQATAPNVMLLLENTAGQGSYLASTLEQLAEALQLLKSHEQIGVCLDTCHLFVAGYDFRTEADYRALQKEIKNTIGHAAVKAIHVNDSAKPFASHVDNHAGIGKGFIGLEPFGFWIKDPKWRSTPGILETPGGRYRQELALLRKL